MAAALISFIGTGMRPQEGDVRSLSRSGYVRATYRFPAPAEAADHLETASLFGAALLLWLRASGRPVSRWLVLGTPPSLWCDLAEAFPEGRGDGLLDCFDRVADAVKDRNTPEALLREWERTLAAIADEPELQFRITGAGETPASQWQLWNAILAAVGEGDEVILDITHGFRHLPVLASFMVMLLRWLRSVPRVDLYYGALDMGPAHGDQGFPVLHLPLCGALLEATEAVATLRHTGSYGALADCLQEPGELKERLQRVAFADEINQADPDVARTALERLDALPADALNAPLAALLAGPLGEVARARPAERLGGKARLAFDHGQLLKALGLLWEGVCVAGCLLHHCGDEMHYQPRTRAGQLLKEKSAFGMTNERKDALERLRQLRNAAMHGTDGAERQDVREALRDPAAFARIFREGEALLHHLIGQLPP